LQATNRRIVPFAARVAWRQSLVAVLRAARHELAEACKSVACIRP
jgi:hypothetical protein